MLCVTANTVSAVRRCRAAMALRFLSIIISFLLLCWQRKERTAKATVATEQRQQAPDRLRTLRPDPQEWLLRFADILRSFYPLLPLRVSQAPMFWHRTPELPSPVEARAAQSA